MTQKQYINHILSVYNYYDSLIGFGDIMKDPHVDDQKYNEMIPTMKTAPTRFEGQERTFDVMNSSSDETRTVLFRSSFNASPDLSEEAYANLYKGMGAVVTLYNWGKTKVVYDFNKEISDAILESIGDNLWGATLQCLEHLPLRAFYMKFPSVPISKELHAYIQAIHKAPYGKDSFFDPMTEDTTVEGALCYWEPRSERFYFCVQYSEDRYTNTPILYDNSFDKTFLNKTIEEVMFGQPFDKTDEIRSSERQFALGESLRILVPYLVYLTAESAEIPSFDEPAQKQALKKPTLKNIRQGEVGKEYRIRRRKFRQKYSSSKSTAGGGNGSMKAPHVRRAHYAHYWYGKKDSPDRQVRLKWVPETYVHKEQILDIKPTVVKMT